MLHKRSHRHGPWTGPSHATARHNPWPQGGPGTGAATGHRPGSLVCCPPICCPQAQPQASHSHRPPARPTASHSHRPGPAVCCPPVCCPQARPQAQATGPAHQLVAHRPRHMQPQALPRATATGSQPRATGLTQRFVARPFVAHRLSQSHRPQARSPATAAGPAHLFVARRFVAHRRLSTAPWGK